MNEFVSYEYIEEGIALVTICNPPVNVMTDEAWSELDYTFYKLSLDKKLRCVIITAKCEKNIFVGGSNVKSFLALDSVTGKEYTTRTNNIRFRVYNCPVPVICALNGSAIGGGLGLALMCDYRISHPDAQFGVGEINMGILGFTQFLMRRVHNGTARKMIYGGIRLKGEEAMAAGLIDEIVPKEEVLDKAVELARTFAKQSPLAVRSAKKCVLKSEEEIFTEGGQSFEDELLFELWGTEDQKEAVNAFLEKRSPEFKLK